MANHKDKFLQYLEDIGYEIKEEPNNTTVIIYNDLTTDQLLGLYKAIFDIDYKEGGSLRATEITTGGSLRPTEKRYIQNIL